MSDCRDKTLLVHALADDEVDAANVLAIEAHLATCAACRAERDGVLALRAKLRAETVRHVAPDSMTRKIEAMLAAQRADSAAAPAPPPAPPRAQVVALRPRAGVVRHMLDWRWATGAITGLAAGLALMLALPRAPELPDGTDLVAGHVRSLMARHLTDVETSDKHVVKPWFNGKLAFAPPVPNLDADGFPLAGGRLDFIGGRDVAALVYRRRLHVINVFVAPPQGRAPADAAIEGYTILHWNAGGLEFSAVSDLNAAELRQFRALFRAKAAG